MLDVKKLQALVGSPVDGILGPNTYTAMFRKTGAGPIRAQELALAATVFFDEYLILDNPLRLAHFMAQAMHESGRFRYMEEIASGEAYEGRKSLGNTYPGDGKRYKGRGIFQLTGRNNYRKYGRLIGIDLERHPQLAAIPSISLHIALEYWLRNGLSILADNDNILKITKLINGGYNGLEDRKKHLATVKKWLI